MPKTINDTPRTVSKRKVNNKQKSKSISPILRKHINTDITPKTKHFNPIQSFTPSVLNFPKRNNLEVLNSLGVNVNDSFEILSLLELLNQIVVNKPGYILKRFPSDISISDIYKYLIQELDELFPDNWEFNCTRFELPTVISFKDCSVPMKNQIDFGDIFHYEKQIKTFQAIQIGINLLDEMGFYYTHETFYGQIASGEHGDDEYILDMLKNNIGDDLSDDDYEKELACIRNDYTESLLDIEKIKIPKFHENVDSFIKILKFYISKHPGSLSKWLDSILLLYINKFDVHKVEYHEYFDDSYGDLTSATQILRIDVGYTRYHQIVSDMVEQDLNSMGVHPWFNSSTLTKESFTPFISNIDISAIVNRIFTFNLKEQKWTNYIH